MITLAPSPSAENTTLAAALRIKRILIGGIENIIALTEAGAKTSDHALTAVAVIREQAQLSTDWAAIHGITGTDRNDLGTGSTRELVFVLGQIATETKVAADDAGLACTALQDVRARASRVLSSHRAA